MVMSFLTLSTHHKRFAIAHLNHPNFCFVKTSFMLNKLYKIMGVWLERGCRDRLKESINRENIP